MKIKLYLVITVVISIIVIRFLLPTINEYDVSSNTVEEAIDVFFRIVKDDDYLNNITNIVADDNILFVRTFSWGNGTRGADIYTHLSKTELIDKIKNNLFEPDYCWNQFLGGLTNFDTEVRYVNSQVDISEIKELPNSLQAQIFYELNSESRINKGETIVYIFGEDKFLLVNYSSYELYYSTYVLFEKNDGCYEITMISCIY